MLRSLACGSFWVGLYVIGSALGIAGCGSDDGGAPPSQEQAGGGTNDAGSHAGGSMSTAGAGGAAGASGSTGAGGNAGASGSSMTGTDAGGDAAAPVTCKIPATEDAQPKMLSQTGCVDPKDPKKAIAAMIPYDVNSPLWSDGAAKERYILLPAGQKIHVKDCTATPGACQQDGGAFVPEDEGHWDLPVGTVLMKTFSIAGKHIETRLLMRMTAQDDWLGFSYEWNDAETEATLLDNALDKPLATQPAQTWHFPGRAQCLQCHTAEAGRSLGPSTQQFNKNFNYAAGMKNQVTAFTDLGLFDTPPKMIAGYPTPSAAGDLTQRARSYLQANCAICHRPGGPLADVDLRFTTSFKDTRLCNQMVARSSTDYPPLRLVPGNPALSTISYRMHDTVTGFCGPQPQTCTNNRMPKIGSYLVDPDGTKLIDDWIKSIASCPP